MNLTQLKDTLKNLRSQMSALIDQGNLLIDNKDATLQQLTDHRANVETLQARMDLVQSQIEREGATQAASARADSTPAQSHVQETRVSNEYHRAFATALRRGLKPTDACPDQRMRILYDVLKENGGNPAGTDGGFLVPEDVQTQIMERIRQLNPLRDLFTVEPTNTSSGSRVMDNAPTTGLTKLTGEAPSGGIAKNDQPIFSQIAYTVDTYGLIIPISRELAADNDANLLGYVARWFAKKQVLTENGILKTLLEQLTASSISATDDANAVAQLKSALNTGLDPAISLRAAILTNQSGFDYLDSITDAMGRPLLQPDPASGTPMLLKTHPIKVMSDATFPNRTVASGIGAGDYYPIYLGDFTQYGTLFERVALEMESTTVGGQAFSQYTMEVRGITRLGASRFDPTAAIRREIFMPAV
ncbi:MAG: phage major capsid protein [Clostridia bacterium]